MCLAPPALITEIRGLLAAVEVYGTKKEISLYLLPEEAKVGDYVLVHAGFAIQKIDEDAAVEAMAALRELAEAADSEDGPRPTGPADESRRASG